MIDYSYKRPGRPRKKDYSTSFGRWLGEKLDEYDITEEDLANMLGVGRSYVSKMVRGITIPTNIMALACSYIFEEDGSYIIDLVIGDRIKLENIRATNS